MPIYDYKSDCNHRFERLVPTWRTSNPPCPHCGCETQRMPSRTAWIGGATAPVSYDAAPTSWNGLGGGNRDAITHWRRKVEERRTFEERNPEHLTRRDAIASHEGVFEGKALTYRELAARSADSGDASVGMAQASKARKATQASPQLGQPTP
jgi:putative FmdB family regulatory protein